MSSASPSSLELAQRLLALEAAGAKKPRGASHAASRADPAVRVCEELREVLTVFAGAAGFRSLLTRALTLAKAEEPSLAPVRVLDDGSLAGLDKAHVKDGSGGTAAAGQVLVAQLLDLLVIFIGEPLTNRLVRSAWPELPATASRSITEDIS